MIARPKASAVRTLIHKHQLVSALLLVIIVTLIMTSISMTLYIQSGASGLDLSRPGFSNARSDLQQESATEFKSTGTLTTDDVDQFKKLYQKQRDVLNSLSAFDDDALSDKELGLIPPQEPETAEAQ